MMYHWLRPLIEMPLLCTILFKVTALLAVAWMLHQLLARCNPYWRLLLWRGIGLSIIALPLLTSITPTIPISIPAPAGLMPAHDSEADLSPDFINEPPPETAMEASLSAANAPAVLPGATPVLAERIGDWIGDHWAIALLSVWIAGTCALICRWLIAWVYLRRAVCDSIVAGDREQQCLRRTADMIGCSAAVQLRIAEHTASPMLAGIRKPVILLPRNTTVGTCSDELSAILAHELTHLYNRDLPWMAFLRAATVACWWHPLVWVMCRAHSQTCEEVCDANAAAHVADARLYSRTLARVALAALTPMSAMAGIPMARPAADIFRRLSRLTGRIDATRPGFRRVAPVGLAGAVLLIALNGLQPGYASTSTAPSSTNAVGGERVLHFPKDRSLGTVKIQDADLPRVITTFYHWTENGPIDHWDQLGEAQGDVTIPAGKRVMLVVSLDGWKDLSPLKALRPDDIDELVIRGMGMSREASAEWGFLDARSENASDAIMPHIAHLTGLKSLSLRFTDVTSKGLRHIEQLRSLECLFLPRLADDSGMTSVAKLTGLKRLYFKENNVTNKGIAKLTALRELEQLELGGKKMNNGALVHLKKLPKLYYLCLWGTTFTDAGMVHLKDVSSLRIFWPFRMSTIGDEGLAHLSKHPSLERINLCFNEKITDLGMVHLAKMKSLRQLDITHTKIGDVGAEHLQKLTDLELLEVPDGISRPAMVDLLATKPRLRWLTLNGSSNATYGDEMLEQVGKMADLEHLYFCGKQVTDTGMTQLAKCRKLKSLSTFLCPITDQGLGEIGKLTSLEMVEISGAKLTTSGLAQLNGLTKLQHLSIAEVSPDKAFVDVSGMVSLRKLAIGIARKGEPLRDEDLACLAKLPNLEWFQMGFVRGISDKGLAHLAGLTKMDRLTIGGEGITDAGLAHLANMKRLDLLSISGNLTEKGLMSLQQNPNLTNLTVITPNPLGKDMADRLMAKLPKLIMFKTGPDLQHLSPQTNGAFIRKTR